MRTDQARVQHVLTFLTVLLTLMIPTSLAQVPPEVAMHGYAETVFFNGKIVSMDDKSTSTAVGSIYQGIAVKGNKIVKLGTSGEVRALAGPATRVLDLQGRTLLPGIIEPHMHIYGEAVKHLERFGFKYPPNGIVGSTTAEKTLEETQSVLRKTVQDAVKQVDPGQWVVVNMGSNPEEPTALRLWAAGRRLTNRDTLDMWAPENPVLMSPGIRGNINT